MPDMLHALLMVATLAGLLLAATGEAAPMKSALAIVPVTQRVAAEGITMDDAIRKVRETYGDVTILKAESRDSNGGQVYRIKFLTESGRVKTVTVDATTGEFR